MLRHTLRRTVARIRPRLGWIVLGVGFMLTGIACSGGPDRTKIVPNNEGDRGESCRVSGDCNEDLACVNNVCVKNEYDIERTSNVCRRIECSSTEDCCELSPECQTLKQECDNGDDVACDEFDNRNCGECDFQCKEGSCVEDLSCEADEDCGFDGNCKDGKCVQCESNAGCPDGTECKNNECQEVCEIDENCPLFHECQEGDCVETGCKSNRECVLFADDGDATCQNGECLLPCTTDAECNRNSSGFFQICENDQCKFVGCENDRECRVALGLEETEDAQATCEPRSDGGG